MKKLVIRKLNEKYWKEYKNIKINSVLNDPIAFVSGTSDFKNIKSSEWKSELKKDNLVGAFIGKQLVGVIGFWKSNFERD